MIYEPKEATNCPERMGFVALFSFGSDAAEVTAGICQLHRPFDTAERFFDGGAVVGGHIRKGRRGYGQNKAQ